MHIDLTGKKFKRGEKAGWLTYNSIQIILCIVIDREESKEVIKYYAYIYIDRKE